MEWAGPHFIKRNAAGYCGASHPDCTLEQAISKGLAYAAAEIRNHAPVRIDDETTLIGAEAEGTGVTYFIRLNYQMENVPDWKSFAKTHARETACNNDGLRKIVGYGGHLTYAFSDVTGRMASVSVSEC